MKNPQGNSNCDIYDSIHNSGSSLGIPIIKKIFQNPKFSKNTLREVNVRWTDVCEDVKRNESEIGTEKRGNENNALGYKFGVSFLWFHWLFPFSLFYCLCLFVLSGFKLFITGLWVFCVDFGNFWLQLPENRNCNPLAKISSQPKTQKKYSAHHDLNPKLTGLLTNPVEALNSHTCIEYKVACSFTFVVVLPLVYAYSKLKLYSMFSHRILCFEGLYYSLYCILWRHFIKVCLNKILEKSFFIIRGDQRSDLIYSVNLHKDFWILTLD